MQKSPKDASHISKLNTADRIPIFLPLPSHLTEAQTDFSGEAAIYFQVKQHSFQSTALYLEFTMCFFNWRNQLQIEWQLCGASVFSLQDWPRALCGLPLILHLTPTPTHLCLWPPTLLLPNPNENLEYSTLFTFWACCSLSDSILHYPISNESRCLC